MRSESDVLCQFIYCVGIFYVLRKHLELVALAVRKFVFLVSSSIKQVKAAADKQFWLFLVRRKVFRQLRFLFREPLDSVILNSKVIVDMKQRELSPFAS